MALAVFAAVAAGCGGQDAQQGDMAVEVQAMQVVQRDTPVSYEFVGQIEAKNEVEIRAKVSGNIVARMVDGGVPVRQGQPLFQIDQRQYRDSVLAAQAQLAQVEAGLANSRLDVARYSKLAEQQAVAQQVLDNALAAERQNQAQVEAERARLQQAQNDLSDTLIVSPVNGRIDVNILPVGSFVQAGGTPLAKVSSMDPVLVRFSMSENEYLHFVDINKADPQQWGRVLKLVLGDGTVYPLTGKVEQVNSGISQDTGTMTFKAVFQNTKGILVPGMFARIVAQGETHKNALLVPQRAVQQLLGKTFITLVGKDGKAESRPVAMGPRVGDMWIVESGLTPGDKVVVEGFLKAPAGTPLKVTMIGADIPAATTKPVSQ
jgi:membrane fusion protein (multidrug efflux system)